MQMTSRSKTFLLALVLSVSLPVLGSLLAGPVGAAVGAVVALAWLALAFLWADRFLLGLYHARPLSYLEAASVYRTIQRLVRRAGVKMPELWLIPEAAPNALAVVSGHKRLIGVTEGLLRQLNALELEAVLAQRLAYLTQPEARLASIVGALASAAFRLANFLLWGLLSLSPEEDRKPNRFARMWEATVLPWLAQWVRWSLPPTSFFLADHRAAEWTGSPSALASALRKIGRSSTGLESGGPETAHLFLISPWPGRFDLAGWKERALRLDAAQGQRPQAA
ncbi:MAG: M48 family metalloprotease [Bryobacteraceae bacterium]|nr:M48 family metalloprotease [Bryobacteraceae bacterium]MDW8377675.1 M48 family metalloprotease [Bryobacterales bacterium]